MTTKTKPQTRTELLDHVAELMRDNLNDGVESIYQWERICLAFADGFDLTNDEKVYFLDKCDFDMVLGHEWRYNFLELSPY